MTVKFSRVLMMATFLVSLITLSCKKNNFDEPSHLVTDPNLDTITIAHLRSLYTIGLPMIIDGDVTISGTVTGDDKSGNLYKTIVIQDNTAAIPVLIERSTLYTDFPMGRKVYIKCKGLVIGHYNNYLQLGGYIDYSGNQPAVGNIPSALIPSTIIKGPMVEPVAPKKVRIQDLNDSYQAQLIQIDSVEFTLKDADEPYADIVYQNSLDRYATDCGHVYEIDVRTSNFAKFANQNTPTGNGSLVGIYSVYGSDPQLTILDPVTSFTNPRCDGIPTPFPALHDVSIADIRALYTGVNTTTPLNAVIRGTVLNDYLNKNESVNNVILQDATGGIVIRFEDKQSYKAGSLLEIRLKGDELTLFSGQIEVNNVPFLHAAVKGTGTVVPQTVSLADLLANYSDYEMELVKLENVTLTSGSGLYGGNVIVSDGTDVITLRTNPLPGTSANPAATFAASALPATAVNLVAYVLPFGSTKQIKIRSLADVTPF
jgi:hypothetical protein